MKHSQCKNANTLDSVAPRLALLSVIVVVMWDRFGRWSDFQWLLFRRGKKRPPFVLTIKIEGDILPRESTRVGIEFDIKLFSSSRRGHLLRQVERPAAFRDLQSLIITKLWFQGAK